tara:strand:- start:1162 stop:1986 length:825 start_codon:yes stop_codon:yes gene_type:complete
MSRLSDKYGKSAIVLGCAEGLGEAFIYNLRSKNITQLFLVDNNSEALERLASEVKLDPEINNVSSFLLDLTQPDTWDKVTEIIVSSGIRIVIINAAYGPVSLFESLERRDLSRIINLNVQCPTQIVHEILNIRNDSLPLGIVIISSLSAYYGGVGIAAYAASKSYLLTLGRSLYRELKPKGVDILTCCPGMIDTPGLRNSNPTLSAVKITPSHPSDIASATLNALGKKAILIPGRINRLSYFIFNRLLSYKIVHRIVDNVLNHMYDLGKQVKGK